MAIVFTNCTNRKKGIAVPELTLDNLSSGSMDIIARQWLDNLQNASPQNPARETYCGRGFRDAEASAIYLSSPLYVVSAGLGIINSEQSIPVYSLTVSPGTVNSVRNKISDYTSTKTWWSKIVSGNPFGSSLADTLEQHPEGLILVALSRPYVELLYDELLNCSLNQQYRLRFFGKKLDSALPPTLNKNWMPYDDRLDCAGRGYSGTQTDFAQRSLRHFVTEVLDKHPDKDTFTHRLLVEKLLASLSKRETPKRKRLSDEEIGAVIQDNWEYGDGQSSTLLRILRRDLGIACEQSRFRNIYQTVKNMRVAK
jgi:hypothetical protein